MDQDNNNHHKVQVEVITGSSKVIGKAIATEFAKAGYCVVINARDKEELKQASEDISQSTDGKNKVIYVPGDISQEQISESRIFRSFFFISYYLIYVKIAKYVTIINVSFARGIFRECCYVS